MGISAQGREKFFFIILVYFSIVTFMTGAINLTSTGAITIHDFGGGSYGQTVPGQVVPSLGISSPTQSSTQSWGAQDYTSSSGYEQNLTVIWDNTYIRSDGVGFSAQVPPPYYDDFLSVKGTVLSGGMYDSIYFVNNQFYDHPTYYLVEGSDVSDGMVDGLYIRCDSGGIYLVRSTELAFPTSVLGSINYPDANLASKIETQYFPADKKVDVWVDDNYAGELSGWWFMGTIGASQNTYHTGVLSSDWGFSVSQISGTFSTSSVAPNWYDAIVDFVADLVSSVVSLYTMIITILGLTSNSLVPFWVWAIFSIPALATLIFIYLSTARGS